MTKQLKKQIKKRVYIYTAMTVLLGKVRNWKQKCMQIEVTVLEFKAEQCGVI